MNSEYRYQLEKYRGRGTRYNCPQCGRKYTFTRYIDTHNGNTYVNERVGKCNRLDKCGYHYTPRQYFEDNPWLREERFSFIQKHRDFERMKIEKTPPKPEPPKPAGRLPRWVMERTLWRDCDYKVWLRATFGEGVAQRIISDYYIGGGDADDPTISATYAIFWQVDANNNVRTGKIMNYDPTTGKRIKGKESYVGWVHSLMRSEGVLPEGWNLVQCLYGEHLLKTRPTAIVALAEGPKTAHIGSALMPDMVWLAVDSMMGLSTERLRPLKGREVILFPDQGKGFEEWTRRIAPIAAEVGFRYSISAFMESHATDNGEDIGDLI